METRTVQTPTPDNPTITVQLPPWLAWQAARALAAAGIPHDQAPDGTITTMEAGQAVIDDVLARHGQARQFDPLRRQRANRSLPTDALGFALALAVVGLVIWQSAPVAAVAASVGLDPDLARGAAIAVAGLGGTMLISEGLLGGDGRRWLFVVGMCGLFGTAAFYFIMRSLGVL